MEDSLFGLFDSPHADTWLHVREGVKDMIFILNRNPTSSSFLESRSFNMVLESGLTRGPWFKPYLWSLFPIC